MTISVTRTLFTVSILALFGVGCAATPASGEEPDMTEDGDESTGSVQQATIYLDNCADGSDANERFSIGGPGTSSPMYYRSSTYLNPGQSCGSNARRVTIVDYDVNGGLVYPYKFYVGPWGSYSLEQCNGMHLHVRVQRRNKTTLAWEDVDHKHGDSSNPDTAYDPYMRGQLTWSESSGITCRLPYYDFTRYNGNYSTTETSRYRVRAYLELPNGTYASIKMQASNVHGY